MWLVGVKRIIHELLQQSKPEEEISKSDSNAETENLVSTEDKNSVDQSDSDTLSANQKEAWKETDEITNEMGDNKPLQE